MIVLTLEGEIGYGRQTTLSEIDQVDIECRSLDRRGLKVSRKIDIVPARGTSEAEEMKKV